MGKWKAGDCFFVMGGLFFVVLIIVIEKAERIPYPPYKEKYRQSSNLLWIENGSITELENNHRSYSAENPGSSYHSHF